MRGLRGQQETPRAVEQLIGRIALRIKPRLVVEWLVGHQGCLVGIGHIGGHGRLLVLSKHGLVFPHLLLENGLFNRLKSKPRGRIGLVVAHELHLALSKGIHSAAAFLAGRDEAVVARLGSGFEAELRIVPHSALGWPLKEIVYGGIIAAIVEVLRIEGTTNCIATQTGHGNAPILSPIVDIGFLGTYASIVFGAVAISKA